MNFIFLLQKYLIAKINPLDQSHCILPDKSTLKQYFMCDIMFYNKKDVIVVLVVHCS